MNRVPINFTDLPAWARDEVGKAVGSGKKPQTHVHVSDGHLSIGAVWHDHYRRRIVAHNGEKSIAYESAYYESLINASPSQAAMYRGGELDIPETGSVLIINIGPTIFVDFYIHRHGPYMSMVNGLPSGQEVSDFQYAILDMIDGHTSAGRKDFIGRHGVPRKLYDMVCAELQDMGFLSINKAGAVRVTIEGKQYRTAQRSQREWSWYDWDDCYSWSTRKYSGFAAEIFSEYREKLRQGA